MSYQHRRLKIVRYMNTKKKKNSQQNAHSILQFHPQQHWLDTSENGWLRYTQIVENSQMRMWIVHEKCVNVNDKHEMRGQIRKYMHENDATLEEYSYTLNAYDTKLFLPILWVSEWVLCVCIICKRFCAESPNVQNHPYCFFAFVPFSPSMYVCVSV